MLDEANERLILPIDLALSLSGESIDNAKNYCMMETIITHLALIIGLNQQARDLLSTGPNQGTMQFASYR
jgi:hypothetical protein